MQPAGKAPGRPGGWDWAAVRPDPAAVVEVVGQPRQPVAAVEAQAGVTPQAAAGAAEPVPHLLALIEALALPAAAGAGREVVRPAGAGRLHPVAPAVVAAEVGDDRNDAASIV